MVIKGYHTENMVFDTSEIMGELLKNQKNIMFSGSGASHQNWAPEKIIITEFAKARAMLMNTTLKCTEGTFPNDIYPTNVGNSVWFYNHIPYIHSSIYAIEIWSISRFNTVPETLHNFHLWRYLTYILEPKLQNIVLKIPKWDPRS